jgi:hypothetical protein
MHVKMIGIIFSFLECVPPCEVGMKCDVKSLQCVYDGMPTDRNIFYVSILLIGHVRYSQCTVTRRLAFC